jgi:Trypsin
MKRAIIAAGLAVAALALAGGTGAISNGVPDGNGHPNVGLLAIGFEIDGELVRFAGCSGSYGGPRVGQPAQKVFVTAAHCVNGAADAGITPDQFSATFDSTVDIDIETGAITSSNTWHQASAIAFDSGKNPANAQDYAVVLLTSAPAGLNPIQMPTAGLLANLAAKGGLKPGTVIDNVGYGVVPSFTKGPPQYDVPPGRMFSTSLFKGLTQSLLKLNSNPNATPGNGGACFGDSGSPKFLHGTNTAVALQFGGDAICRAENYASRLDIPAARAFYGQYLALP